MEEQIKSTEKSEDEIYANNISEITQCLTNVAESSIIMKMPAGIDTAVSYLMMWDEIRRNDNYRKVKSEILQIVIEDVPHQYQERLLEYLK